MKTPLNKAKRPANDDRETCGLRTGGWVCIADRHPGSDRHYFRKESKA